MTMKRFAVALLTWVAVSTAWAAPITDTLVIDGKEWAQVNLFTGLSWNDINAVCPGGECIAGGELTANGQTWDMPGWTWAASSEVDDLLAAIENDPTISLIPGMCSDGFAGFSPNFCAGTDTGSTIQMSLVGWTSSTETLPSGEVGYLDYGLDYQRNFEVGELFLTGAVAQVDPDRGVFFRGAWFYRAQPTPVPAPATLPLLGLALLVLIAIRSLGRRLD